MKYVFLIFITFILTFIALPSSAEYEDREGVKKDSSITQNKDIEELNRLAEKKKAYLHEGKMQEYADVSEELNKKISTIPPSAELYEFLANEKFEEKDYNAATEYYQKTRDLLERDKQIKDVSHYLTVCFQQSASLYSADHFEEALAQIDYLYDVEKKYGLKTDANSEVYRTHIQMLSLQKLNRIDDAFKLINQKIENLKDNSSSHVLYNLYQLRMLLSYNTRDFANALVYACKADSVLAVDHPETDDYRLTLLLYIIDCYSEMEKYDEAVKLARHRIDIKQDIYKNDLAEYKKDVFYLAQVEAFSGKGGNKENFEAAKKHIAEYAHLESAEIKQQAPWLTSEERNTLWNQEQKTLKTVTGFAAGLGAFNEQLDVEAYNAHVLTSGLLLKTEKSVIDAIMKYGTDEDRMQLDKLNELRYSMSEAIREQNIEKKANYQIAVQTQENMLLKKASKMPNCQSLLDTDYSAIHSALKPGEVLVDFLEYSTQTDKNRLNAFIIRPEWEFPMLVRICNGNDIDVISESLDAKIYEDSVSQKMRTLLMDSILTYVHPGERIYYVPDGVLHGVALENLQTKEGKTLSDYYDMHRLSSAASLLEQKDLAMNSAVLYGGLNYGDYKVDADSLQTQSTMRDGEERGVGDAFCPLAGTLLEVKKIISTLKKSKIHAVCYEKDNGTEESFVELDGKSPDIIHLATHGYYLSPERAKKVTGLAGYTDAMLLSGLVMSGGNAGWLGIHSGNSNDDGLLSADEISKLDLSRTKLVVLSACKTASGKISPDGVFGLQRAFKKAGAGTIIMTLWGVNDKVTSKFMEVFYKELTKNHWNKCAAFNNARQQIKKEYSEPYYWAGFIMLD